ncbi:MAG TPA: penicillin acylase family protein [Gemmataceae bacterium]|nr:penicillin acylase family protein [Gemmataceae bacterium]
MKRLFVAVILGALCLPGVRAADPPEVLLQKSTAVLAQLEGTLAVPGLKEEVEVLRDRWGVPHIYAKNPDDLFFAQGFVVAQDRLFQLDLWRRVGIGEVAEIAGRPALEGDRFARLLKYRGDMDAEWTSYSPDTRAIAVAFTRGINAYIDHIGDRLPIEFQLLGTRPKKWQPEDILGRMSGIIMTRGFQTEVARAELIAAAGLEKARRLMPADPPRDFAPAPGLDLAGIDQSVLAGYRAATRPLPLQGGPAESNNWVVDGTRSVSGKPLLASDPHRSINLPSLRYLVHLHAPGWNVIGSGEPGIPGVAIGHNEHVAWGFTIVGTDQTDLYVEETHPDDPTQYRVGERWEKMTIIREQVRVKGEAEPVEVELRYTRHGPVIHQDSRRHRAYALRWVGAEPGGAAYLGALALDRARSTREFIEACRAWKLPGENMVFADVDGNIGWLAVALTPVRKGWDGLLPVPGAKGEYEWQGFLPLKDLPQVFNPASHYIATANHNILPPGYPHAIAYEWAPRYRFERIRQRLEAKPKFDLEEFKSIQHDNTTLVGQALAQLVKRVDSGDAALRPYIELLANWDGVLSRESRAGPLYAVWLRELQEEFFRPHVPKGVLDLLTSRSGVPVLLAALEKPDRFWFGDNPEEERDRLLRRTFAAAVKKVEEALPGGMAKWSWGRLHTVTFRHPLGPLDPAYDKAFSLGPIARPGDATTPNAASHDARFRQISGATYRHLFDLADWDRGLATSAPGQSGQPGSPHYADLLPLWAEGEYFPLVFSRAKVEQVTKHRLRLVPR